MTTPSLIARRWLRRLERFAEESNELLLVIAVGLGGFYLSVHVILALTPAPAAADIDQLLQPRPECSGGAALDHEFPILPRHR
jgi:hypothetical protein